jgi:hypothetical protein
MRPDRLVGRTLAVFAVTVTALLSGAGAAFAVDYGQTGDGNGGSGGGLAWTGAAAILPLSVIGGALVVLGVCLVILMRRRAAERD